jgi:hypothetical protein
MSEIAKLQIDRQLFDMQVKELMSMKKKRGFMMNRHTYDFIIGELKTARQKRGTKTAEEYNLIKRYDIVYDGEAERLVSKTENSSVLQLIVTTEDLWNVLWQIHIGIGHGGRDRMLSATQRVYGILNPKVLIFPS